MNSTDHSIDIVASNGTDTMAIDVAASEVQRLNADIDSMTRDLVASYWTLGQYLHAVKAELPHGNLRCMVHGGWRGKEPRQPRDAVVHEIQSNISNREL